MNRILLILALIPSLLMGATPGPGSPAGANTVLAGPSTPGASAALPTYRAIVSSDVTQAVSTKMPVRVATTANGTLATAYANGQTVDGVTIATGDRLLLKDQTTASDNGLYTVNASGAPTRATDADASAELPLGLTVTVKAGTANAGKIFLMTANADPVVVGTSNLTFTAISGGGGGGVSDGTYGDIVVSGTGTVWTVGANAITSAKINANAVTTAKITDANVTYAKIADGTGLSVIGRSANTGGVNADIAAASDGQVLRRSGTSIGFGTVLVGGGGTGVTAGTSGGVLYFNSTSTMASSGALTASQIVLGGGAGLAPTSLAAPTSGQILVGNTTTPGWATMGTDATITNTGALTIASNAITTAKINSSAVTTAKIADANVTYAKLDSAASISLQRKNLFVNPRFDIWQRGTSFAAVATNAYTADCCKYLKGGTMVHTVSRDTDVPTVAQASVLANYSLYFDVTTAQASLTSSDVAGFKTTIEGYGFAHIAQRSFTVSFWVKATKTGIHGVGFANSGHDRECVIEYTVNTTNTWEKKTVNVPASPSAGTWSYTNGSGLEVFWCVGSGVGATFNITTGSWQTTAGINFPTTANQVNDCDNTANDFRLALVQIEAGDNATNFEFRPIQQELALCQRCCWSLGYLADGSYVSGANTPLTPFAVQGASSTTAATAVVTPPVLMRTTPTVVGTPSEWLLIDNVLNPSPTGSFSIQLFSGSSFRLVITCAVVAGRYYYLIADGTGGRVLRFECDF